ncbi:alkaline phosphatase [Fontisphaera persica]|uniref:alkaline phosphatase n=1 Tax=Fontisphaera persica TaxID=2974023 RepID=UPI0024BFE8C0|nr:alkaline phosphatase [Fontisphaera persica]WCJ60594.1 alkaline phosphatase [Fontisphaera persica]
MLNRRRFFTRAGLAAAAASVGAPHIAVSAETLNARPGQRPARIIHIVSDGMSAGTLACADHYSRIVRKRPLTWVQLMNQPGTQFCYMNMRSLNSLVTDSAAASSSWGSGARVMNGVLNVLPNGKRLTPLYTVFGELGWTRALVTTTEITHATPAGFAANVRSRENPQLIAAQYLERRIDILLGGGKQFFEQKKRLDKRDLKAEYRQAGYSVVETRDELKAAPKTGRLLGIFTDSHLPYTVDHQRDAKLRERVPTLAEMTAAALERLANARNFILQIEGGRVDHAAHSSCAAGAIRDQIALDEAIDLVVAFVKEHPDTLVVMTTDHGNSNPGLNGMGGGYSRSPMRLANIEKIKGSVGTILDQIKKQGTKIEVKPVSVSEKEEPLPYKMPTVLYRYDDEELQRKLQEAEDKAKREEEKKKPKQRTVEYGYWVEASRIVAVVEEWTGYKMPVERARWFQKYLLRQGDALFEQLNNDTAQLGQLLANYTGVNWIGNSHTSDYSPVVAFGPGSERFKGLIQNTDVFGHYVDLAGVNFRNPSVPEFADADIIPPSTEDIAAYGAPWVEEMV